jgi:DNA polymerase
MSYIVMDLETRCCADLKKIGGWRYSLSAEVLCLAYRVGGGNVNIWTRSDPPPFELFQAIKEGLPVHAFNYAFEYAIWNNVLVKKHGWPEIPDDQWRCTMAEGLAVGLTGSLDKMAKALGSEVQKDSVGRRVMLQLAKPRQPTKNDKSEWFTQKKKFDILYQYCKQDVEAEDEIHRAVPRLNPSELNVFQFDRKTNMRGIRIDRELASKALRVWKRHCDNLVAKLSRVTNKEVTSAKAVLNMLLFLKDHGVELSNLQKETVDEALPDAEGVAKEVLKIRQELALSSIAKFEKMIQCMDDEDDRIRGVLQYHGAQTGRYAGRMIQIQNFPRGGLKEEEVERLVSLVKQMDLEALYQEPRSLGDTLSGLLRSAIIPAEGKKFIVCDFAAIEARGLAWAARENWLLDTFRAGKDVYVEMAANGIYGIKPEEVTKDQRFYGKQAILGCGYQMGADKFYKLLTETYKVETTREFAKQVVDAYRESNQNIKRFWYVINREAIKCVRTEQSTRCGPFKFHREGRWLKMRLPCGRDIAYLDPKIVEGRFGSDQIEYTGTDFKGQIARVTTYGGRLCVDGDAEVLTDSGWKRLSDIQRNDLVFDGEEFVSHDGVVFNGTKEVGRLDGVWMTPDHKVLTHAGNWVEASQCEGFEWQGVRSPNGHQLRRFRQREEPVEDEMHDSEINPVLPKQTRTVFDIVNCGPRNRFLVKGNSGSFVVHNCENAIQAVCRDLLVHSMSLLEKAGYTVVAHVHDEVILEVDEDFGSLEEVQDIMRKTPKWAGDIPIEAEGFVGYRYRK